MCVYIRIYIYIFIYLFIYLYNMHTCLFVYLCCGLTVDLIRPAWSEHAAVLCRRVAVGA